MFFFSIDRKTQKKQEVQRCHKGSSLFLIFFSESIGPIGTKLGWKVHWTVYVFFVHCEPIG